jgi:hypothetical protein
MSFLLAKAAIQNRIKAAHYGDQKMLSNLEIQELIERTKDMREEDKIDFIYEYAFTEAMQIMREAKDGYN